MSLRGLQQLAREINTCRINIRSPLLEINICSFVCAAGTFSLAFATPQVRRRRRYSFAAPEERVVLAASFCEVWFKDIGIPPPAYTAILQFDSPGPLPNEFAEEFESSFCRALAETFIGISSANTASALWASFGAKLLPPYTFQPSSDDK